MSHERRSVQLAAEDEKELRSGEGVMGKKLVLCSDSTSHRYCRYDTNVGKLATLVDQRAKDQLLCDPPRSRVRNP